MCVCVCVSVYGWILVVLVQSACTTATISIRIFEYIWLGCLVLPPLLVALFLLYTRDGGFVDP